MWIGVVSVLIFSSPNLMVLAFGGLAEGTEAVSRPGTAELVFALVVTLVFQVVVFALALLPLLAAGRPYRRLLGPSPTGVLMVAVGLGVGAATAVVAYTVNAVLIGVFETSQPVEQQLLNDALAGGATTVLVILIAVVAAPITEEVVFRGVLFRSLSARTGVHLAAVVSSAVFALIHFEIVFSQPLALGGLFVVGLALAYAFHATGNLLVPILGHAVFNAISVSLAILVDRLGLDEVAEVAVIVRVALTGVGGG